MGNPSYLGSKAFDVCLFLLKDILRDEHRKGAILDSYALDLLVEPLLDFLPDEVRGGLVDVSLRTPGPGDWWSDLQYVAARYIVIVQHVPFGQHLLIPS